MKRKLISILFVLVLVLSFSLVPAVPVAAQEDVSITDPVSATITKTDTLDAVTFDIEILSENVPHGVYGVSLVFATSLDQPAFQVCYAESAAIGFPDIGWWYWDYGTGWGTVTMVTVATSGTGITAAGDGALGEKVFTVTIPTAALGGYGATYYYAIQVRTNCIGWYPAAYDWSSDVSAFAECKTLAPPTKADILNGVPGKGLDTAPGLQESFNPNSQADNNAGKK